MPDATIVPFGPLEEALAREFEKGDSKEFDFFRKGCRVTPNRIENIVPCPAEMTAYQLVVERDRIKVDIDYRRDLRRFADNFWSSILTRGLQDFKNWGQLPPAGRPPSIAILPPAAEEKRPYSEAVALLSEIYEDITSEPGTLLVAEAPFAQDVVRKVAHELDDSNHDYLEDTGRTAVVEEEDGQETLPVMALRIDLWKLHNDKGYSRLFREVGRRVGQYFRPFYDEFYDLPTDIQNFIRLFNFPQVDYELDFGKRTFGHLAKFDPNHLFWEFTGIEDDINITFRLKVDAKKLKDDAAYRDKFITFASQTITYFEEVSGRDGKVPDGMLRGDRDAYETETKRWGRPLSTLSMEDANFQRILRALCAYASRVKATEMAEKEEGGQRFAIDPPAGTLWTSVNPRSTERSGMTRVVYEGPEVVHYVQGIDGRIHRLVVQSSLPDAQKIVRNEYGNMLREAEGRGLKMAGTNPVTGRLTVWLGKEHTSGTTDVLLMRIRDKVIVDEVYPIHRYAIEHYADNIEDTAKAPFRLTGFHLRVKVYWNGRVKVEQTKRGDLKLEADAEHRKALEEEIFRRGGFLEFIAEEVRKMRWPIMAFKESHTIDFEMPPLGSWQPKDLAEARSQAGPLTRLCHAEEELKKWDDAATIKEIIKKAKESLRTAREREVSGDKDGAQEIYGQVAEGLRVLLMLNAYYLDAYEPLSEAVLKLGRPYSLEGDLCLSQIFEGRLGPARERVGRAIRHRTREELDLSLARRLLGEVRADLEPLVILYPSHSEAYSHYRFAQLTLENYDRLIEVTRFLLKGNPSSVDLLQGLAEAFHSKGLSNSGDQDDLRKARELYKTVVISDPKRRPAYVALGAIHEKLGEDALALEAYRKSLVGNTDPFYTEQAQARIEAILKKQKGTRP